MRRVLLKLWREDDGFIVSTELILIATILVLGLVAGLSQIAATVNEELNDVALAIGVLNQSYSYGAASGHHGISMGSLFQDAAESNDTDGGCLQTCTHNAQLGTEGVVTP